MKRREFSRFVCRGDGIDESQSEVSFGVCEEVEGGAAKYAGMEDPAMMEVRRAES